MVSNGLCVQALMRANRDLWYQKYKESVWEEEDVYDEELEFPI